MLHQILLNHAHDVLCCIIKKCNVLVIFVFLVAFSADINDIPRERPNLIAWGLAPRIFHFMTIMTAMVTLLVITCITKRYGLANGPQTHFVYQTLTTHIYYG